jgi:transcriptional regulator with XRE-family HTH domain
MIVLMIKDAKYLRINQIFSELFYKFFTVSYNSLQNKFLQEVESLGLRFPVAEISDRTGIGQPTVSVYLSGKRPVSQKFYKSFCEAFRTELSKANAEGKEKDPDLAMVILDRLSYAFQDQAKAMAAQAEAFKVHAGIMKNIEGKMARQETLQRIETNLESVLVTQDAGFGLVVEILKRKVREEAKGNPDLEREILADVAERIGSNLGPITKSGIEPG